MSIVVIYSAGKVTTIPWDAIEKKYAELFLGKSRCVWYSNYLWFRNSTTYSNKELIE